MNRCTKLYTKFILRIFLYIAEVIFGHIVIGVIVKCFIIRCYDKQAFSSDDVAVVDTAAARWRGVRTCEQGG